MPFVTSQNHKQKERTSSKALREIYICIYKLRRLNRKQTLKKWLFYKGNNNYWVFTEERDLEERQRMCLVQS